MYTINLFGSFLIKKKNYCCFKIIFVDLTNVGWGHLLQFDPSYVKKIFTMIQDAMSARFKGIHYYRPPTGFETFVNIMKSVLSEKNKQRV